MYFSLFRCIMSLCAYFQYIDCVLSRGLLQRWPSELSTSIARPGRPTVHYVLTLHVLWTNNTTTTTIMMMIKHLLSPYSHSAPKTDEITWCLSGCIYPVVYKTPKLFCGIFFNCHKIWPSLFWTNLSRNDAGYVFSASPKQCLYNSLPCDFWNFVVGM